jgi:peptide/nickel transport system substrate-binding protein
MGAGRALLFTRGVIRRIARVGLAAALMSAMSVLGCGGGEKVGPAQPPQAPPAAAAPAPSGAIVAPQAPPAPSKAAAAQYALAPDEGMPQYGGVLRRAEVPPKVLTFLDNVPQEGAIIISPVYNKLVDREFEGGTPLFRKIGPSLAKTWDVSPDGTVWTFRLQAGVRFHDGTPFTSADVKATYDHFLNPGNAGPPGRSYISPFVASVEAPDPGTLVLRLKTPTPVLLDNLSVGWAMIAPKKYLDQGIDWFVGNAIGTGPFRWNATKWERGISHQVDRNPDYWETGLPYLDGIITYGISDPAARIAAFETKKVDQVKGVSRTQRQELIQRYGSTVRAVDLPGEAFEYLQYNTRKPPFDNVKVRQALNLWIDHSQFREKVWQGEGYLGSWIEPHIFPGYGTPLDQLVKTELALQPDKTAARKRAKELLAEAGFADLSKFRVRVLPFRPTGTYLAGAQVAAAQLREIGFDAVLETKEALAMTQALSAGDYEVSYYSGGVGYSAPDAVLGRYLSSKGQRNYSALVDATLDRLIGDINTLDPEKRRKAMRDVELYLLTGQNALHLVLYQQRTVLEGAYLRGHRYIEQGAEEMNTRTWLTADAPTRK